MKEDRMPVLYRGRRTAAEMRALLAEMEKGLLRQKDFAVRHGTSVAVLHYWKRRLGRGRYPQFLEVEPVSVPESGKVRIELPGRIVVQLEGPLPVEALVKLSRAFL